jgi:hypothetical protein
MVLPAAIACDVNAAESASTDRATIDAIVGHFQREMWNILMSPDVKLVKTRSSIMQAARYLGALTRCNFELFETCTKRVARQSGSGSWPRGECTLAARTGSLYKSGTEHFRRATLNQENSDEPRQSSV